jgi:hypothetical protein
MIYNIRDSNIGNGIMCKTINTNKKTIQIISLVKEVDLFIIELPVIIYYSQRIAFKTIAPLLAN